MDDSSYNTGIGSFKNNIVYNAGTGTDYCFITNSNGTTLHSNNLYYRVGTGDICLTKDGSSYYYQSTVAGWESTSKHTDPLFTNLSTYDFTLTSSSPAIGAGTNLSLPLDYAGNSWNATPSIGAYEYGSTGSVLVTSITVSGAGEATTITTKGGTLQMSASILPEDATDKTVTWSRTNGTGTASISSSGLLTALTDGTVTVRATANDGSNVYDDQEITLSNQSSTTVVSFLRESGKFLMDGGKLLK